MIQVRGQLGGVFLFTMWNLGKSLRSSGLMAFLFYLLSHPDGLEIISITKESNEQDGVQLPGLCKVRGPILRTTAQATH